MPTFTVYPKEGETFSVNCERIDRTAKGYALYRATVEPSKVAFLSIDQIAAIIPPTIPDNKKRSGVACLSVYLRDRPPFEIFAHAFDVDPFVTFYLYANDDSKGATGRTRLEWLYIDPSELIAILPSTFLPDKSA